MMRNKEKTQKIGFLLLSASLHALLLAFFLFHIKNSKLLKNYGNSQKTVISSYLYQNPNKTVPNKTPKPKQFASKMKNALGLTLKRKKTIPKKTVTKQAQRKAKVKGAPMPALMMLLHKGIQANQRYPASAQAMEREGNVTVFFTLHENGSVDHINIAKSSGTRSLDFAAMNAIKRAAPFKGVNKFINHAHDYQINVIFRLS